MKTPVFANPVVLMFLSSLAPLAAQNLQDRGHPSDSRLLAAADLAGNDTERFTHRAAPSDRFELPSLSKAPAFVAEGDVMYVAQDWMTLDSMISSSRTLEDVADLDLLREPSSFGKVPVNGSPGTYPETVQNGLALISAVYREAGKPSDGQDCMTVGLSVQQQAKLDPSRLLMLLEKEISANPSCACEIVKHAIRAGGGDAAQVAMIVEVASTAAPEMMRMISQCAIAEAPEALGEIQSVMARLEPNGGESVASAKSSKGSKAPEVSSVMTPPALFNPLDRLVTPPIPPIIYPRPVSSVDPSE
jgi:hypothetical protein